MKDGYVWGRGTPDDKDKLTANLMTLLLAKRAGLPLDRDLIFLAESAEEIDSKGVGIRFMVNQHFDAIDAEFAITEGPGATIENGRTTVVQIATSEKLPRHVRLVASGTSGHGSIPRIDNAVTHLVAAVEKVGTWQTPIRLNNTTRTYFEKLAKISPPEQGARYRVCSIRLPRHGPAVPRGERAGALYGVAHLGCADHAGRVSRQRDSIEAEATIDIRALPDEDMPKFYDEMRRVINDPAVRVIPETEHLRPVSAPSPLDTDMFRALERVSRDMYPGSTTLPTMQGAATDMSFLRPKGIKAYGIGPASTDEDTLKYGAHGDVERLRESSLYGLVEFTWRAVVDVASIH